MKRIITILAAILLTACTANLSEDFSGFYETRSDFPLENTVWKHTTGEKFDRYVTFREGEVSLFYGVENERWSDFYSSPYTLKDGIILTSLHYPLFGKKESTETANIIKFGDTHTIVINSEDYCYYGPYSEDFDDMWMTMTVTIKPFEYGKD